MDLNDRIHMLKACKVERKRMIMKMQTPGILLLCKDITREALPTLHQTPLNITFVPKMDCLQHELETEWNPFSYRWFLVSLPTMENVRKVSIEMRSGARSSYILGQYQEVWRIIKMFCSTWKQMDSKLEELKVRIRGTKEWKIEDQAWTIPGSQKKMVSDMHEETFPLLTAFSCGGYLEYPCQGIAKMMNT